MVLKCGRGMRRWRVGCAGGGEEGGGEGGESEVGGGRGGGSGGGGGTRASPSLPAFFCPILPHCCQSNSVIHTHVTLESFCS